MRRKYFYNLVVNSVLTMVWCDLCSIERDSKQVIVGEIYIEYNDDNNASQS